MTDIAYRDTLPCGVPLDEIYAQVVDQTLLVALAGPHTRGLAPPIPQRLSGGWAPD